MIYRAHKDVLKLAFSATDGVNDTIFLGQQISDVFRALRLFVDVVILASDSLS